MLALGSLPTAVETNTRCPQTIGLETARPGTGAFHNTFSPVETFHLSGAGCPSATPDAFGPLKDGQFWPNSVAQVSTHTMIGITLRMIYLPCTRVNTWLAPPCPRLNAVTLPPSTRNTAVSPGASAIPNVVGSRAMKDSLWAPAAPVRRPSETVRTTS